MRGMTLPPDPVSLIAVVDIDREELRLRRLRTRAGELPERPGVYLHKNVTGEVVYVGKARNLRARVRSYFTGVAGRDSKTLALVDEIDRTDYVLTNNELEAILLENNLIKTHQPRFNILLKDDKTYPVLKVTLSEDFPRVVFTRKTSRKKGDRYFGPFFAGTARKMIKLVQDQFHIRSCDIPIREGASALPRPCLYYDMHRCPGPCVDGLTDRKEYLALVDAVILFLSGKNRELIGTLKKRMYAASESEEFELAKYYRDLIRTTERTLSEQTVSSVGKENADAWGVHEEGGDIAVQIFVLRNGNLVDRRQIFFEGEKSYDAPHFLGQIMQRYYQDNLFIPPEVLVPFEIDDHELAEAWLSDVRGARARLRVPSRGRGKDRVQMAVSNAVTAHQTRFRQSTSDRASRAADELGRILGVETPVRHIECFDISNTQGTDSVAGMVVFRDGAFAKGSYRVFNIRTVEGADDFRSMAEAVERRYKRVLGENRELPDLILIDGGRGQLNAAGSALEKVGARGYTIAGLAKREEEVYLPNVEEPLKLSRRSAALQLLQVIRDETHRFAITSHRKRRTRRTLKSELSNLTGIGENRRRLLLEHFGSLASVKQASRQDLSTVLGPKVGSSVFDQLHG